MSSMFGYTISETLYVSSRTCVFRAYKDDPKDTVILRTCGESGASSVHESRLSSSHDVLKMFDHPNIVKSLGWIGREVEPCLVLEDIQGIDLRSYSSHFEKQQYTLDIFMNIAIQMAEALSVIHHAQVIHKDLHPGNIIVNTETGQVQVIDFGLASLLSREQPALDITDRVSGILAYLSPEQTGRMNRALDYRTDFYTLGVTFYQMLTGELPFVHNDALGLVYAHIAKQHTCVTKFRRDVPSILARVIDKCMMKNAEDRYQSALGLQKDLLRIQAQLKNNIEVKDFELGQEDISDRFEIPQKLYGREEDIDILMQAFARASEGRPQMLVVSGTSGIGKSALVNEVHKPIARNNGLFCSGKFDQFQKNVPYSALQGALKSWIQQKVALPLAELNVLRSRLNETLGSNARVLIDFLADFSLLLGDLPAVLPLGASETQNRFHTVFQDFIHCVTQDQEMTLFIDDIQWADQGTLNLVPLLISEAGSKLLLIVAYRDNEVDEHHPAMHTLEEVRKANNLDGELYELALGPLKHEEISELLSDALHVQNNNDEIEELTKLVVSKTGGNPFFINELLLTLYEKNLLNFDLKVQRWVWDLREINSLGITDNIIDLMLEKMGRLDDEAQELIQIGACIGRSFDLDLLTKFTEHSNKTVSQILWQALKEGLLIQETMVVDEIGVSTSESKTKYSEEQGVKKSSATTASVQSSLDSYPQSYRFLHDRMHQAAYESLNNADQEALHLKLARMLLSKVKRKQIEFQDLRPEILFSIVEHFNKARSLIIDLSELGQLAELNLIAAQQACAATVWDAAATYAQHGIELLEENPWVNQFEIAKQLYLTKAECDYLNGKLESSQQCYDILFTEIDDQALLADICANRLVQCIGKGQWKEAVEFGVKGLDYLGVSIPEGPDVESAIQTELEYLNVHSNHGLIEIGRIPKETNTANQAISKICPNLSLTHSILGNPKLCDYFAVLAGNQVLRDGITELSAILLTTYAFYLRRTEQLHLSYKQAMQAISLAERTQSCHEVANVYNTNALLMCYLQAPLDECEQLHLRGYLRGMENGELARALISQCNALLPIFSNGRPLNEIASKAQIIIGYLNKKSVFNPAGEFLYNLSKALMSGEVNAVHALDDEVFHPSILGIIKQSLHITYLTHYRAELAFWCEDDVLALEQCQKVNEFGDLFIKVIFWVDHLFLHSLLLIRKDSLTDEDHNNLEIKLSKIAELAKLNPLNFEHKHLLLQAELLRSQGSCSIEVMDIYRLSIESAVQGGFVQYRALANELYGEFMVEIGQDGFAQHQFKQAYRCYKEWGCKAKTNKLEERYPYLIKSQNHEQITASSFSSIDAKSSAVSLDMFSVIKSTQAISDELELRSLIEKVMQVIMENAGAQLAYLVIDSGGGPLIEAHIDENREVANYLVHLKFDDSEQAYLPRSIINVTLRSGETVQLHNALKEGEFTEDDYVRRFGVKSALCLPIIYRDSQIGVLYLENNLTTGAFDSNRVDFMQVLLTQAAISLENARLFSEVTELNTDLEKKVEQRTKALNNAIRELELSNNELDAYSRTVSHDLRAPIRHISSFTEMLREELEESGRLEKGDIFLINKILSSSQKMYGLVTALLELSRVQTKEVVKNPVDLSAIVQDFFEEMQQRFPGQKVTTNSLENVTVLADLTMMRSVVDNLVNNAWKYSSKKADAHVSFGRLEAGADIPAGIGNVPATVPEGYAVFYLQDNGDGFHMNAANELFGSFKRLHIESEFEGTGVGLATVKRVIEKHGGSIWVEAYKGKGATFYFTLPLA